MALNIPEDRIQAIRKIVALSDASAAELEQALKTSEFTSNSDEMAEHIRERVGTIPFDELKDITDALYGLYWVREFSGVSEPQFLKDVVASVRSNTELAIDTKAIPSIKTRFKRLLSIEPLSIISKAIGLQRDGERIYCEARIISDIRPVFTKDPKHRPVGAVLGHTLKISYHDGLAAHKDFFVVLDRIDLENLKKVVDRAHAKSEALAAFLEEVDLPDLGL
jgi:hypothetical protein